MYSYFNRFSIVMTLEQAESASHQGQCIEDVRELLKEKRISKQLDKIDPDDIRAELKETGGWDADELSDNEANRERIVWIAAGNIVEEKKNKNR